MDRLCQFCEAFALIVWRSVSSRSSLERFERPIDDLHCWKNGAALRDTHVWPASCRLCSLLWGPQVVASSLITRGREDGYIEIVKGPDDVSQVCLYSNEDEGFESAVTILARAEPHKGGCCAVWAVSKVAAYELCLQFLQVILGPRLMKSSQVCLVCREQQAGHPGTNCHELNLPQVYAHGLLQR